MKELNNVKTLKSGDVVKGIVLKVTDNEVLVDLNYMSEGIIYKDYLSLEKIQSCHEVCKVGDEIEAKVSKVSYGDDSVHIYLSRVDLEKQALVLQHRHELVVDAIVEGKVKKVIDQGIVIDYYGTELFCPASLVD